jgi:signal transduction histidine kinase
VLDVPTVLPTLPLSAEVRHNLLLTTREALQNAVTHAAATEVHLYLKLENNSLTIAITDNGSGFDPNHLSAHGNGLSNMRLRLQAIGGKLTIDSRVGNGTTVSLQVPESALHVRVIVRNGNINHDS